MMKIQIYKPSRTRLNLTLSELKQIIINAIDKINCNIGSLNIVITTDNELLRINKEFLKKDYLTDIITFNYANDSEPIDGEIYISLDRVKENGKIYKVGTENELKRVLIHGILHLKGYRDYSDEEKKKMRELENYFMKEICST